jgi:hypothetical protein
MRALLLFVATLLFAAPAAAEPVRVTVTRQGDHFIADYVFPTSAAAWGFWRSSVAMVDKKPFRPRSWTVLTPGARLERRGRHDALVGVAGRPVPRRVRVRVAPFTGHLVADYVPAMRLGGRSLALFDGHFEAFSIDDPATLDALPSDSDHDLVGDVGTAVQFKGPNLRLAGDVEGYRRGQSSGAYGLFGVRRAVVRGGVATVTDSELPWWIANDLAGYTPRVMRTLTAGLGPPGAEPTILAAWEGAERNIASMNGGTLKGLIVMRFEGQKALKPDEELRSITRWFVAHEAAHFWLGQVVSYATVRDSWIMEGGADLLAMRTLAKLDRSFDAKRRLNRSLADCAKLAVKPVATAHERGEHDAFYACGAVFALAAERASEGDFFAFVRGLIEANGADGRLTRAEWLDALGRPAVARHIALMLDQGAQDPGSALATLLTEAGIAFHLNQRGVPQL